jgi:hypothetical protein
VLDIYTRCNFLHRARENISAPTEHQFFTTRSPAIFHVANETGELQSPTFSLALRHLVRRVFQCPSQIGARGLFFASRAPAALMIRAPRKRHRSCRNLRYLGLAWDETLANLFGAFSRFETAEPTPSRIGTANCLRTRKYRNGSRHALATPGEACSRLLTPQRANFEFRFKDKRSRASAAGANKFSQTEQTLSKRRGRSLVSSDECQYHSDWKLVVASATSKRRALCPLVRCADESKT